MLAHPIFSQHLNLRIQMSKRREKQPTFNVIFILVKQCFNINNLQGILQIFMLATLSSLKVLVSDVQMEDIANIICQLSCYSRYLLQQIIIHQWRTNSQFSMLAHPVFPQHSNLLIQMSKRWKKQPTFNVRFPLIKHHFTIK